MKRFATVALAVALAARALTAQDFERLLKAAVNTETVDRNCTAAIEQYKKIAAGSNRAVAAQALVRMAECYRQLGEDAEARNVYERLIREFADQEQAMTSAKTRLGSSASRDRVATQQTVWTGPYVDMFGQVSPDGRLITYVDWIRSLNLMVHDTVTNRDRSLTSLESRVGNPEWTFHGQAEFSTISKDGRQVAYAWWPKSGPPELLALPLDAGSNTKPRRIFPGSPEFRFLKPHDWSRDGRWIGVAISRSDESGQIALIGATDGSFRPLRSVGWRGPERLFFSPDSSVIAYDLPPNDDTDAHDIFVMALDGSREIHAVAHQADDRLLGWSPDGTLLLFSSDRTGSAGLWAQPFSASKPDGTPTLLRSDIGDGISLGITTAGGLYLYKQVNDRDIRTARIDLSSGKLVARPTSFDRGFLHGVTVPDWSPDGAYLAYQAAEGDPSRAAIAIRSVPTGEVRRLPGLYARDPRWSPDGRSLITAARDRRGRNGIFQVDVQSGHTTPVIIGPGFTSSPQWSADGTKIYYKRGPGAILERDLESGAEREMFAHPQIDICEVSPDGRLLAVRTRVGAGANLMVVPLDGGPAREVLPAFARGQRTVAWTPDSRSVVVLKYEGAGPELWLVGLDGEPARRLETDLADSLNGIAGGFSLSRDGQRIALVTGTLGAEVWALENFLPGR